MIDDHQLIGISAMFGLREGLLLSCFVSYLSCRGPWPGSELGTGKRAVSDFKAGNGIRELEIDPSRQPALA